MGLEVLSDLSEILPYPIPNFPLFAGIGRLGSFNQYTLLYFAKKAHPERCANL